MDEVVENLRACLLSSKGGVSVNRINKDYYDVVGERIPYRRFNFQSLEEFLGVVPEIKKVLKGGECFIEAIPSEKTSHLAELVRKQKSEKKSRKVTSYNRPVRTPYGSNQNYQRNQTGFRTQSTNTRTPSFSNARLGNARVPLQTPTNRSSTTSPISTNTSFKYPPSTKTDYIPLMSSSVKPPKLDQRQNYIRNPNEAPRISPTKRMMNKDLRSRSPTISEASKPKSSLQNRLIINAQPKTNETVTSEENLNGTHREEPKSVLRTPIIPTTNNYQKEGPRKYQSENVASIIPFEDFVKKTPQDELQVFTASFNLSPPAYKILPAKNGSFYAQVIVGNEKYSSYPEDAKNEFSARSIAATKALDDLKEKHVSVGLPVTKDERLIKQRMLKIVDSHPSGVFTSQFIKYYKEDFKELLPEDWMRIVNECSEISIEIGANNTSILTRYTPSEEKVEEVPPKTQFNKMRLSPLRSSPGVLQVPNDRYWITYVTVVYSSDEIWVRLVGEEYSDQFDVITKKMKVFYTTNFESTIAKSIEVDAYYAVCVEQNWYRVRCLEFDPTTGNATVYFIDHGDDEICHAKMLHDLDKQFCDLPAQALRLSLLHGLEDFLDFNDAELIVEKFLLERTLYVEVQNYNSEEKATPVIFYDTNGPDDVNVNKLISVEIVKNCMTKPQLNTEGRVTEIYVSHISQIGEVYLQLRNENMQFLIKLMNQLIHETLSQDLSELAVTTVNLLKLYVVKCPEDANWYRAQVMNVNYTTKEVDAFLLDYGKTLTVKISSLIELESVSEILAHFPPQALQVHLYNIPPTSFDPEKVARLTKLAPSDQSLLVKVVQKTDNGSPPVVELFKRQQPANEIISINNTLVFDSELTKCTNGDDNNNVKTRKRSERLTSRYGSSADRDDLQQKKSLRPPKIPGIDEYFDVHVTLVSNPGNFVVQPFEDQTEFKKMHQKLQEECKSYKGVPPAFEYVKEGNLYAAQHPDGDFYRVCILNKFMDQMVTVYFCDYGDVTIVPLKKLQPLSGQFFELPYQAIRAKLADVKPVNVDWSVEDCLRFKDLIEEKDMVSVVRASVSDQSGETVLSLSLIDVSEAVDIHIDEVLINEGRAQRPESYVKPRAAQEPSPT